MNLKINILYMISKISEKQTTHYSNKGNKLWKSGVNLNELQMEDDILIDISVKDS